MQKDESLFIILQKLEKDEKKVLQSKINFNEKSEQNFSKDEIDIILEDYKRFIFFLLITLTGWPNSKGSDAVTRTSKTLSNGSLTRFTSPKEGLNEFLSMKGEPPICIVSRLPIASSK